MRRVLAALCLTATGAVFSQGYRVELDGGPLTLSEDVSSAVAAWEAAAPEIELEEDPESTRVVSFADQARMGPDIVTLTVQGDGEPELQVWVAPENYRRFPGALHHEVGLLLGLPASSDGIMDPALEPQGPTAPTSADLASLAATVGRQPGDVDGDGSVGFRDLAAVARAYGERGVNLPADLDGDGVVGPEDLALLRENYEFTAPSPPSQEESVEAEAPEGGANGGEPAQDRTEDQPRADEGGESELEDDGSGAPGGSADGPPGDGDD